MDDTKIDKRAIKLKIPHQVILNILDVSIDDLMDSSKSKDYFVKKKIKKFIFIVRKHSDMSINDLAFLLGRTTGSISNINYRFAEDVAKDVKLYKEIKRIEIAAYGKFKPYIPGKRKNDQL